jgi:hypothetical protein
MPHPPLTPPHREGHLELTIQPYTKDIPGKPRGDQAIHLRIGLKAGGGLSSDASAIKTHCARAQLHGGV